MGTGIWRNESTRRNARPEPSTCNEARTNINRRLANGCARHGERPVACELGDGGNESVRIGLATISTERSTILDVTAVMPLGVIDDQLIAVTVDNNIVAVPIDIAGERVTGLPVTVASGATVGPGGGAKAVLSVSGTLVYLSRSASPASPSKHPTPNVELGSDNHPMRPVGASPPPQRVVRQLAQPSDLGTPGAGDLAWTMP